MNEVLIENHNALVKPSDHWTCLGDVTMIRGGKPQQARLKGWISRLNGHKRLIMGNHDHFPVEAYLAAGFEKVMAMNMYENMRFIHIPIHTSSMGMAAACVHGHIHNQDSPPPVQQVDKDGRLYIKPYINLSVEVIEYRPVTLGEIKSMVKKVTEGFKGGFNLSTQHCEICADDDMKLAGYRCPQHLDT